MKIIKRYILLIFNIVCCIFFMISCSGWQKDVNINEYEINLNLGSIVKEDSNGYQNYNLDKGKYVKAGGDRGVFSYNKNSGNYMYIKDGKNIIHYKDEDIEIKENNIIDIKMSKMGNYISFFNVKDYYKLKVINLDINEEININSNVAISGDLLEWLDDELLVYYGVDNNKRNGIFTYDLKNNKEKLIYQLHNGYIEFLKATSDGIIFIQHEDNNKVLKFINKSGNIEELSKDIWIVKDIEITNKGIFVLGSVKNNTFSLYKIENGEAKRLIYDFPKVVNMNTRLSSTESGDILFIGSNSNTEKGNVFIYEDGYVKALTNEESKYHFVKFN